MRLGDRTARRVSTLALGLCLSSGLGPTAPATARPQDAGKASLSASAAAQDLPSGRAVVDRYIEAIGGVEAVKAQKAQHARGKVEAPAQGIGGDLEVIAAPPDRFLMHVTIAGIGEISTGYDGKTGWLVHPALGPMVLDGLMLQQTRQQADMYSALHPERFVKSLETVEKTEFDGRECYKVRVVTQWDEEYHEFFDTGTGLMVGLIRKQASPMGDIEATTVLSDYQKVDGLLVPMRTVQKVMGTEQIVTFDELSPAEPGEDTFAPPAEIKALMSGGNDSKDAGGSR